MDIDFFVSKDLQYFHGEIGELKGNQVDRHIYLSFWNTCKDRSSIHYETE